MSIQPTRRLASVGSGRFEIGSAPHHCEASMPVISRIWHLGTIDPWELVDGSRSGVEVTYLMFKRRRVCPSAR
jgi:hypothetical protein